MEGGNVTAKVGDTITLPDCTKDGHEFIGWYDNDTCAGKAGEKYTVTGDVTLKAHYEKKAEVTYLITFDPNGGRKADHIRAAKGEKIILPGTEKSGYIFLGWYTEKKGGILLGLAGDELEVTKDMTVYALWEKEKAEEAGDKDQETCRAVFHTEGGTLKNKTVTIAKGAGLYLPLPEREGYDFTGWYLDQSLTQFAGDYRDSYRITKDIDFYAKWEKSKENGTDQGSNAETAGTYTVKYDANGGTVKESSAEVAKGAGVKLPAAEREGFNFKGWYTDKQVFIGMAGDTYKPEGDICLYAKWESAASGNSNGSTADTGNSSDANAETSTDSSAAGKSADTGAGVSGTAAVKEPMIQTGRTSPIYLLAALGMSGILLAVLSICEGKRSSME
jgi:Listeria/Bacterioides repeat/Listeria/Bacterioides repeat